MLQIEKLGQDLLRLDSNELTEELLKKVIYLPDKNNISVAALSLSLGLTHTEKVKD